MYVECTQTNFSTSMRDELTALSLASCHNHEHLPHVRSMYKTRVYLLAQQAKAKEAAGLIESALTARRIDSPWLVCVHPHS